MAEVRVHGVREIDRRGAARQVDDLALRREHVDGVGEEALLERGEPLARIGDGVLPVEHLPQPRDLLVERGIGALRLAAAFLVAPVRGDTVLGMLVHLEGADLHFERLVLGSDHRRVQRAVVVGLRLRDVVVELARERRPAVMHEAEHRVAVLHRVDENAHRPDVVQRIDAGFLAAHLGPDAVDVLGPPGDLGPDAGGGELVAQRRDHVLDVALAVEAALVEHARNRLVAVGLERTEAQVLELPLQLPDTQAVGERREQVEHLARRARAQRRVAAHERAQRLRALRELDQHDADVFHHREQHLAQVLGLRRALGLVDGVRRGADVTHARDATDQRGHVGAESRGQVIGVEGAGHREAEQQRTAHRVGIEAQPGEDGGGAQRTLERGFPIGHRGGGRTFACICEGRRERGAFVGRIRTGEGFEPRGNRLRRGGLRCGMQHGNHAPIIRGARRGLGTASAELMRKRPADGIGSGAAGTPCRSARNGHIQPGPLHRAHSRDGPRYVQPPSRSVRICRPARIANAAIVNVGGDAVIVGNVADPMR